MKDGETLLDVRDLRVSFPQPGRGLLGRTRNVAAVRGISFSIDAGETLGLVGESGSGKSSTGRALLGLNRPSGGSICFLGRELLGLNRRDMGNLRDKIQMVFQDPYSSLDPSMAVLVIVAEPADTRLTLSRSERVTMVSEALRLVGLDPTLRHRYPNEFSGGQRQRIAIARAIILRPQFIVCDEAVSALDVSTKAHVVSLLKQIQRETGASYLFISHDLAIVRNISARIAVMYAGQICETGPADQVCLRPAHPYTLALVSAHSVPDPRAHRRRPRIVLQGEPASPLNPPAGCAFHPRCPFVMDICRTVAPALTPLRDNGMTACHLQTSGPNLAGNSLQAMLDRTSTIAVNHSGNAAGG